MVSCQTVMLQQNQMTQSHKQALLYSEALIKASVGNCTCIVDVFCWSHDIAQKLEKRRGMHKVIAF